MTGGGDDTSSPYLGSYAWTATTNASGTKTVTASNNAGLTNTDSFALTPDTTAPTGVSAALTGGPYYTGLSVPLTLDTGNDAGSGIDATSKVVERDSSPLANGTCTGFSGSWTL